MKLTKFLLILFFLLLGLNSFAQEEKPDIMPEPIDGPGGITKNVVYPQSAKEAGIEGKVVVKAIIDEKGNVVDAEVIKSVNEDCDNAAVDAIKKTKFTPGIKDDKPVKTEVTIPIMFKLQ